MDDAPKLDLGFGTANSKNSGGNFSGFGGWEDGNTGNTGSDWCFNGADIANTGIPDSFAKDTTTDTGAWSFGGNTKNKTKTNTSGFEFGNFGTLEKSVEDEQEAEETNLGDGNVWGGSGKKDKKPKKKGVSDIVGNDPDSNIIGIAPADPESVAEGSSSAWATPTTKKKKGKKGGEDIPPPPPAAPVAPSETAVDEWVGNGNKKEKKKGKKITEVDETTVTIVPESEPIAGDGWGTFGKKEKKKSKKELEKVEELVVVPKDPESEPNLDFGWGNANKNNKKGKKELEKIEEPAITAILDTGADPDSGLGAATKKDKKKGKNDGKIEEPAATAVPEQEPGADIGWGSFAMKEKKKGKKESEKTEELEATKVPGLEPVDDWGFSGNKDKKKGKKSIWDEPEKETRPIVEEDPVSDIKGDTGWGTFGLKKDKKKANKETIEDIPESELEPVVEEKPDLLRAESKKEKKSKKALISEVKEDPLPAIESKAATDAASVAADDDRTGGWGSSDKKKENKKNKRNPAASSKGEEVPSSPPPVPNVPVVPNPSSFDLWGTGKKDKDRKVKKGKVEDPDPGIVAVALDPVDATEEIAEYDWGASSWGNSGKDKKRREKEKEKEKEKEREEEKEKEKAKAEKEEQERRVEEELAANEKEKSKYKGKIGKKAKINTSQETSKTKDLFADSVPNTIPSTEKDNWGSSWGASAKDMKKGKKSMAVDPPPPAPTPPAQGLTPEPEEDLAEDDWGSFAPAKTDSKKDVKKDSKADEPRINKKGAKDKVEEVVDEISQKSPKDDAKKKGPAKEDTPAKAAKSFWGRMATNPASKPKDGGKDKDVLDEDEIVDFIGEPPGKKCAKDSKLSNQNCKESDKVSEDGKSKGLGGKGEDSESKEDVFSLWGSSKKTSGKKTDEAKKEIGTKELANQNNTPKKGISKEIEPPAEDDQPSKTSKPVMSSTKSTAKSSVLQRVKEIEKDNNKAKLFDPIPDVDPEPISKTDKKVGASSKFKDLAPITGDSKRKDLSLEILNNNKTSKDSVPGSFPGEFMDDDFNDLLDESPIEKKESKESSESKKTPKSAKEAKMSSKTLETPESKHPPTPPPEPKEEKPAKKERARVVKDGGATSWGLWGAAAPRKDARKESKSKDDAEVPLPPKKEKTAAPGLSRSKSTRTSKEKDKETVKSDPKSSDSEKQKKTQSRPPKSRGTSFGGLFGTAPSRTKSVRRSSTAASVSKSTSRHEAMDVDATGLPSPPTDEGPEMTAKVAKMMGMGTAKLDRNVSTRGKQKVSGKNIRNAPGEPLKTADASKTAALDPYAIDSDDMVMVNGLHDPIINAPTPKKGTPKEKSSKGRSKVVDPEPSSPIKRSTPDRTRSTRDSKMETSRAKRQSKADNDFDEDMVMVDAVLSEGADAADGPNDMQFITKPKGLQRSATSAKKPDTKIGGLFGAFRKSRRAPEIVDRPKSKGIVEEEVAPRKRTVTGGDDSAKRPRRDDRKRSSAKTDRAAEGFVYGTAGDAAAATDAEEADARREERRAKRAEKDQAAKEAREEALKYEADRRARRREAEKSKIREEKDRKARKEEEAEARRQEDKQARRAARDARRAKDEAEANRDLEDDILKSRSKHHDTNKAEASSSRHQKSDRRRRSYIDNPLSTSQTPDDEEARRLRRDERRAKAPGRMSAAPVEDYFDPRNGARGQENDPYGGNDHTSSWVKSQLSEPPEPLPVEPTIVEPAPDLRAGGGVAADDLMADEYVRRVSHKKPKRVSRMYTDPIADDREERRRRRESRRAEKEGIGSGEGSDERHGMGARRQSDLGGVKLGAGTKTFDGRTGQGKRSSWFQKLGI